MKRMMLLISFLLCLCFCGTALATDPIWVDGQGNIITGGTTGGSSESETMVTPIETPAPETDADDTSGTPKWVYDPQTLTARLDEETVKVLAVGTYVSIVQRGNEREEIYTRDLSFAADIETDKQLAIINAPKTGKASMFKKASGSSAIIMKCQTGRVVPVLALTKQFALVQYEDAVGYVKRSSLTFVAPYEGEAAFAYIAYKGNARSRSTVKVRQKASGNARILGEFPCGQRVVVVQSLGKWTEIEAENLHGFILAEFLTTLTEEEAAELPLRGISARKHVSSAATDTDFFIPATSTDLESPDNPYGSNKSMNDSVTPDDSTGGEWYETTDSASSPSSGRDEESESADATESGDSSSESSSGEDSSSAPAGSATSSDLS